MRSKHRSAVAAIVAFVAVTGTQAAGATDAYDRPGRTEMVSVSSSGKQMKHAPVVTGLAVEASDITADGRYVAFATTATGLAPGDEAGAAVPSHRIYVRDRKTRRTVQASVTAAGAQQVGLPTGSDSLWSTLSADGRYVAFVSDAINLVPGDTNLASDVFVKDLRSGKMIRASVSSRGVQGDRASFHPSISADGRYVAFTSAARNLVAGEVTGQHSYRHDLKTGRTVLVSANLRGRPGNGASFLTSISADGRYVAFGSHASDLVRKDSTAVDAPTMFRRDVKARKTVPVSVASDGTPASFGVLPSCFVTVPPLITLPSPIGQFGGGGLGVCGSSVDRSPRFISADGRYIVFESDATNLVPNDSNASSQSRGQDVFVHDVKTGRTERISVDSYGRERGGRPYIGGISAGGRYVHYSSHVLQVSAEQNLVDDLLTGGNVATSQGDSYLYDRVSGAMDQTSRTLSGKAPAFGPCINTPQAIVSGDSPSTAAGAVSENGRYVAMRSNVTNLVAKDTNKGCDFFVRDRGLDVGVGGFGGVSPSTGSEETCVGDHVCLPPLTVSGSVGSTGVAGADLIGARVVPRPGLRDLFVRLDVSQMAAVSGVPSGGVVYGLRFTASGERYEVRAQRVPGADFDPKGGASFGLFRQDPTKGLWTKVAVLKGGYGTTGPSVVFAVPTEALGGGDLSDVRAFTGVGSYLAGVTKSLDTIRLGR